MSLTSRVRNAYDAFSGNNKAQNGVSNQAADFLRHGNRNKPMIQGWSQVEMSDQDMYTGYSYAAINKRANRAAVLGKRFLYTEATQKIMDDAKVKQEEIEHPYLTLIKRSKDFTQKKFWHDISTYLDLEGVYYLMAVRAVAQNADGTPRVGEIQKFVMLNPYQIKRVRKESTGELGGYIESRDGMYREIPKEMIIEVRLLNPFDNDTPFSMTDAAKESQFTLKQAGDYTRHSIQGNTNAPGAITTDVVLEPEIFDNFVSRIKNHEKGEPLYGNGAGAINWSAMQIDLDKAALDKINEIHRSILFAVSGTSKTTLGIEESGTTRDTSQVQKDNFTEDAVMPQIEEIIDALNLDYRRYYSEWENNEYEILLDNPLESDREAELKDIEIRESEYDLTTALVDAGYEYDLAVKYAHGDISLAELGEPTLEPELTQAQAMEIAAQQLGLIVPGTPAPTNSPIPQPGSPVTQGPQVQPAPPATSTNAVKEKHVNTMTLGSLGNFTPSTKRIVKRVTPEENDKKVEAAKKELIAKKKAEDKAAADALKAEEKAAKQAEKGDKAPADKPTETPTDTPAPEVDEELQHPPVDGKEEPKPDTTPTVKVEITTPQNDVEGKTRNQIAARDIPDLYDGIDIDMENLGCIMMDTVKIPVAQYVNNPDGDLVDEPGYGTALEGEVNAHVTLLFGLLENGNLWRDKVDRLLDGWSLPTVRINEVSYFDLGDSYAIVGLVDLTPELLDGHERLTLLPHINTFSEYHPHITLAYVNHDTDPAKWTVPLNKRYAGQVVATAGINYGDLPEDEEADNSLEAKKAVLSPGEAPHSHSDHEHDTHINSTLDKAQNALEPDTRDNVVLQESSLYTQISQLEADMAQQIIAAYQAGKITEADNLLSSAEQKKYENELAVLLTGFFTVLYPIYAGQLMANRLAKFEKQGVFSMTNDVTKSIEDAARDAAESHVQTVLKDLAGAITDAQNQAVEDSMVTLVEQGVQAQDANLLSKLPKNPNREDIVKAVKKGTFDDESIYARARELAREGNGLDAITRTIKNEYANISKTRARTIARHETNRVFNMAQYQADLQFLKESGYLENAYKRMYNRANDPCPICQEIITATNANPIPFTQNFVDLGDTISATYKKDNGKMGVQKMSFNYEPITAGNVHVNCRCEYELVIAQADGTFLNAAFDYDIVKNFNPNHDAVTGEFSETGGAASAAALSTAKAANKKLATASSGKTVSAQVEKVRSATSDFLEKHGASADKFKKIDESWVGNDYKTLEKHLEKGDSKEVELMKKLQAAYFKDNGVTEVTLYRGVYNEQAKAIKAAAAKGEPIKISGDYAASFTGYAETARGYADGGAFTAPDKITDSVVIKQTFKVKDIAYSTQVAPFYAGNADDEFIVSTPKGYTVDAANIEVVK